jgi:hypothetical protein
VVCLPTAAGEPAYAWSAVSSGIRSEFARSDAWPGVAASVWQVGWPLRSMTWWTIVPESTRMTRDFEPSGSLWRDGLPLPKALARPFSSLEWRRLPVAPMPLGFAVNTLLYAAALWVPLAGIRLVRRRRTRRLGLWPACRYDLRHDLAPGCPECGWGRAPAP